MQRSSQGGGGRRKETRETPPMGDGGLVSVPMAWDVLVKVGQATGCRLGNVTQLIP